MNRLDTEPVDHTWLELDEAARALEATRAMEQDHDSRMPNKIRSSVRSVEKRAELDKHTTSVVFRHTYTATSSGSESGWRKCGTSSSDAPRLP